MSSFSPLAIDLVPPETVGAKAQIDYSRLQQQLAAQNGQAAALETRALMNRIWQRDRSGNQMLIGDRRKLSTMGKMRFSGNHFYFTGCCSVCGCRWEAIGFIV